MHAIKTILRIILLIIIMGVVGFVLFYVNGGPKPAPGSLNPFTHATSSAPVNQVPVVIENINEQASTSPQVIAEYPQFPTLPTAFNLAVKKSVTDRLASFRQESAEAYHARKTTAPVDQYITPSDFNFIAKWEPAQVNPEYVSFIIRFDSYTGGANENQELQTFNYDVRTGRMMTVADLASSTAYLDFLSQESRRQLTAHFEDLAGPNAPADQILASTTPEAGNFQNFTFTDYLLNIYFPKYSVAPGAFGEQKVVIPLAEVR